MTLNKIIVGSLVAVAAVLSADAFAENWKENKIEYDCPYDDKCWKPDYYGPESLPNRNRGLNSWVGAQINN